MTYSGSSARLGQALRALREQLGITQEELAARSGLHRTYISGLEKGNRNPSLRTLERLGAALNTRPSEILKRSEQLDA